MKRRRFLTVTVGVLVLSAGLMLMTGNAIAAPPTNPNPTAGLSSHWDQNMPSASRFTVLAAFGNQAVRDNNTGLVWEQAPDGTPGTWAYAAGHCVNMNVGGTVGWRLPSVVELKSVQDPTLAVPFVPASAFTISASDATPGVQLAFYWSATTSADNPANAWIVFFTNGFVFNGIKSDNLIHAWCVRGGMNADAY